MPLTPGVAPLFLVERVVRGQIFFMAHCGARE
jgi:hypothetical protein